MPQMNLEEARRRLDREITFFHFKRAERLIRSALREAKERREYFFCEYFTAQRFILCEEYRAALVALNRALRLRPTDGCTYNDKALCYAEQEEYQRALAVFDEGIRKDPDCATLYHNKGWLLSESGEYRKALVCFQKALEIDADRPEALFSIADCLVRLGESRAARAYYLRTAQAVRGRCRYVAREVGRRLRRL